MRSERWYFCACDGWKDYAGGCEHCRQQMGQWVPAEDAHFLADLVYEFLLVGPRQRTKLNEQETQRFLALRRVVNHEGFPPDAVTQIGARRSETR